MKTAFAKYASDPGVAFLLVSLDTDPKRLQRFLDALSLTGGPAPLRDRAMDALSGIHGAREEPQGFEAWLAEELDRRRMERRGAALRSAVDKRLPALALQSLDGRPLPLESYRGKVLLLNFFSSW